MAKFKFEYIWMDGYKPEANFRGKTKVLDLDSYNGELDVLPEWSFDGSSTKQAEGHSSDCLLLPVAVYPDSARRNGYIVVCEVFNADGTPHDSNDRATIEDDPDFWFGFEQEYVLTENGKPLGFPEMGYPEPQGPYYCGVGAGRAMGRQLAEAHYQACLFARLQLAGTNAEVCPAQWEFQVGYRGVAGETADPLTVSDHLWMSRWLLQRLGEDMGIGVSFENKPVKGDWNGAGAHTNFSTRAMREPGGISVIETAIERLATRHDHHIAAYGAGLHETCSIHAFKGGVADRGASIRIPRTVAREGAGYFEDRRPGANCDPYTVSRLLLAAAIERLPTAA